VQIPGMPNKVTMDVYKTTLTEAKQKQGELFLGLDRTVWDEQASVAAKKAAEEATKRAEEAKKNAPNGVPSVSGADVTIPSSGRSIPLPPPGAAPPVSTPPPGRPLPR
jgi:hypothetical protein